jgi:hypothetical protein
MKRKGLFFLLKATEKNSRFLKCIKLGNIQRNKHRTLATGSTETSTVRSTRTSMTSSKLEVLERSIAW